MACVMCGVGLDGDQRTCSMCYGDPAHGTDGIYQAFLDEQAYNAALEAEQRAQWEEQAAQAAYHDALAAEGEHNEPPNPDSDDLPF